MTTKPTNVAERARALLEQKDLEFLPGKASLSTSSSDGFLTALVEGAYLVAVADGRLAGQEVRTLAQTITYVMGEGLPAGELADMLDSFAEALARDGLEKRLRVLAKTVPDAEARREVLGFAALICACDDDVVAQERERLVEIGTAFRFTPDEVSELLEAVRSELR
jgi:tellurite resistance protein